MVSNSLRCISCSTNDTPLWRAGPTGAKTLCNACGVKWKKGKLALVIDGVTYSYGDLAVNATRGSAAPRGFGKGFAQGASTNRRPIVDGEETSSAPTTDEVRKAADRGSAAGRSRQFGTGAQNSRSRATPATLNRRITQPQGRERSLARSRSQTRVSVRGATHTLPRSASWAQFGDASWSLSGVGKPGRGRRRRGPIVSGEQTRFGRLQRSASAVSLAPLHEYQQAVPGGDQSETTYASARLPANLWTCFPSEGDDADEGEHPSPRDRCHSVVVDDQANTTNSGVSSEHRLMADQTLYDNVEDAWLGERIPMLSAWPLVSSGYGEVSHRTIAAEDNEDERVASTDANFVLGEYPGWESTHRMDQDLSRIYAGNVGDPACSVFSVSHGTHPREQGLMSASEEAFMVAAVHGFCVQENDRSFCTNASNLESSVVDMTDPYSRVCLKTSATATVDRRCSRTDSQGTEPEEAWSPLFMAPAAPSTARNRSGERMLQGNHLECTEAEQKRGSLTHCQQFAQQTPRIQKVVGRTNTSASAASEASHHQGDLPHAPSALSVADAVAHPLADGSAPAASLWTHPSLRTNGERPVLTDLKELAPTVREIKHAGQLLASIPPLPLTREIPSISRIIALVRNAHQSLSKLYALGVYRLAALMARFPPDVCCGIGEEAYIRAFVADQASCSICSAQTAAAVHGRLDMQRAHSLALQGFYYDPCAYRRAVAAFRNMYALNELNTFAIDEFVRVFAYDTRVALAKHRTVCQLHPVHSCHRDSTATVSMHQERSVGASTSESSSSSALRTRA